MIVLMLLYHVSFAQLPFWVREERNALIYYYATKGIYTALEIAAILTAVYGFNLRYKIIVIIMTVMFIGSSSLISVSFNYAVSCVDCM